MCQDLHTDPQFPQFQFSIVCERKQKGKFGTAHAPSSRREEAKEGKWGRVFTLHTVSLKLSASFRSFSRVRPIICACYDRVFCPAKELLQIQPVKASPYFHSSIRLRANIKCEDQTPLALPELYFNRMLRFTGIRKYELQVSKILKETTPERDQALLVEQAL